MVAAPAAPSPPCPGPGPLARAGGRTCGSSVFQDRGDAGRAGGTCAGALTGQHGGLAGAVQGRRCCCTTTSAATAAAGRPVRRAGAPRRQRRAKAIFWAVKDELEGDRGRRGPATVVGACGCTWSPTSMAAPTRWPGPATAPTRWSASATWCCSSTTPTTAAASSPTCSAPSAVSRFVALRTARRFDEARDFTRSCGPGSTTATRWSRRRSGEQYAELFAAFPTRRTSRTATSTCRGCGRVRPAGLHRARRRGGRARRRRFGFVGGGLPTPMRTPYEVAGARSTPPRSPRSAGSTCSARTSRPRCRSCCYDTVARRFERGSDALLARDPRDPAAVRAVRARAPAAAARMRIGRTECVNVGHFRATGRPWVLTWGAVAFRHGRPVHPVDHHRRAAGRRSWRSSPTSPPTRSGPAR